VSYRAARPFTRTDWNILMRAVQEDSSNSENRQAAFVLLKTMEGQLLQPEEKDLAGPEVTTPSKQSAYDAWMEERRRGPAVWVKARQSVR
jgi:hypothetical protein